MTDYSTFLHEAGHAAATEFCGGDSIQILINRNGSGLHTHRRSSDGRYSDDTAKAIILMGPEFSGTLMSTDDRQYLASLPLIAWREALEIYSDEQVCANLFIRAAEIASKLKLGVNMPNVYLGEPDPFRMGQICKLAQPQIAARKEQFARYAQKIVKQHQRQ